MISIWPALPLGTLCKFFADGDWIESKDQSQEGIRLVQTGNVGEGVFKDRAEKARFISDETFERLRCTEIVPGDCLISRLPDPVGRACMIPEVGERMITAVDCTIVRFDESKLLPEFFVFYSQSNAYLSAVEAEATGTTRKRISRARLGQIVVPVVPLEDQRRIVAILDEAFEGIATAKANAEKNLQNARELFTSTLADVFNTAWPLVRIEDACEAIMDCVNKTAPIASEPTPYKMLRTTNIRNGLVSLESVNHVSEDVYRVWTRRQVPRRGDVILTREAPMGEVGMLDSDEPVFLGQRLVSYRADASKLDDRFLLYALQSDPLQRQIRAKASGSTVQHMRVPDSKNLQLPLPGLVEQKKAVEVLDAMREKANSLRAQYKRKLAALDELKKSLLQQAFTGQLTATQQASVVLQAVPATTTPEFAANVIALAQVRHERQRREKTFGHVKEQKLLHLVESIGKIDLGRQPMRDAAGPNDFQHMLKAEEWAKAHHFFETVKRGEGYEFRKLSAFDEHLSKARRALGPYLQPLERVIDLLVPMDTKEAEVFATVHAAWNNLLIDGADVTDGAIVSAAREGWHPDKLDIPVHKFQRAIELIRQQGLVPDGTAKYVGGQQRLL